MNKKVFTLLAALLLLLLGTVGASAGRPAWGDTVRYLPDGRGKGAYHLQVTHIGLKAVKDSVLIMNEYGQVEFGDSAYVWNKGGRKDSTFHRLRSSLWCVDVSHEETYGKVPVYSFINKAYGADLAFEYIPTEFTRDVYPDSVAKVRSNVDSIIGQEDLPMLGGPLAKWKFSRTYNAALGSAQLEKDRYLAIEVKPDYYLTFAIDTTDKGTANQKVNLRLVVAHKNEFEPTSPFYQNRLVRFTLTNAGPRVLTTYDFNTRMGYRDTEGPTQLFFDPDVTPGQTNVFAQPLFAKDNTHEGYDDNYMYLQPTTGGYVTMSVTDYHSSAGFDYSKIGITSDPDPTPGELRSRWRLVYYPSEDSLIINVRGYTGHISEAPHKDMGISSYTPSTALRPHNNDLYSDEMVDYQIVRMQDLNDATKARVITVYNAPANTRIHFNIYDCKVTGATKEANLYTITDSKGRYLVVPMYAGDYTPQWMTLNEMQKQNRTPAYQWFVYPANDSMKVNSKIHLVNREFDDIKIQYVQVYDDYRPFRGRWYKKNKFAGRDFDPVMGKHYVNTASFTVVPKPYRNDPYLGYKFFSTNPDEAKAVAESIDSISWYGYAFNYLNELNSDLYISAADVEKTKRSNDSLVYVKEKDKATYFELVVPDTLRKEAAYGMERYGIGWADDLLTRYGFSDPKSDNYIAPLKRWFYHLKYNDYWKFLRYNDYVVMDDNARYAYTPEPIANSRELNKATFYMRFTYEKDGRDFYTLLDRIPVSNFHYLTYVKGLAISDTLKAFDWSHGAIIQNAFGVVAAGVDDRNLFVRAQPKTIGTHRVSTFALTNETEPLYRRFNTTLESSVATDDPDTLKFFIQAKHNAYLYEDAHSTHSATRKQLPGGYSAINFAGYENADDAIKNKDKDQIYQRHIDTDWAIYVDTAYVNRGTGWIKPQYLLVVGPKFGQLGCIQCGEYEEDRPYIYGRFLRNQTDSARINPPLGSKSAIRDRDYIWPGNWDRLSFTPAVHAGDTLWILNGVPVEYFEQKAPDGKLYLNYKGLNTHPRVKKVRLDNNLHKDEVFSFRFIEKAGGVNKDFLIESESADRNRGRMIAPMEGAWIKIENSVPVVSRGAYQDAINEAEIWNVRKTDKSPLANKEVAATDVAVVAGVGNVTIRNAAGKTVVISNVLGQTVAQAVLSSDNETISTPQGVVIVSVEGETVVKAVVK